MTVTKGDLGSEITGGSLQGKICIIKRSALLFRWQIPFVLTGVDRCPLGCDAWQCSLFFFFHTPPDLCDQVNFQILSLNKSSKLEIHGS